jgi:hypothetical protein
VTIKNVWTDADFAEMGWHDAALYSMAYPHADCAISFDIDYIFEWHWSSNEVQGWDVAPCTLSFENVGDLRVSLDWKTQGDTWIQNITRRNRRLSPNGKFVCWDYEIELDIGSISFHATGFRQTVRSEPIFSKFQSLGRSRATTHSLDE